MKMMHDEPYACFGLMCDKCKIQYYKYYKNTNLTCEMSFGNSVKKEEIEIDFQSFIKILIDPIVSKEQKIMLQNCFPEFVERLEKGE